MRKEVKALELIKNQYSLDYSDRRLVELAREHNEINIVDANLSMFIPEYYDAKSQFYAVITGKDVEDRRDTVDLFRNVASKNNIPTFILHKGNFTSAETKGIANVRFRDGGTSGYQPLKWFKYQNTQKAVDILTKLGERMLGLDRDNYEAWSLFVQIIEQTNGNNGVTLRELTSFPYRDINKVLDKMSEDDRRKYRKRYEKFTQKHDISQLERLCELIKIPLNGNCTVGGVIEHSAEVFIDLSRFPSDKAHALQELICMEIEEVAKRKNRKVLLIFDDLSLLKSENSTFNQLLTQTDSHVSVVLSCDNLENKCNGDPIIWNQIMQKADTDAFTFAQTSDNSKLLSEYYGEHEYMTVDLTYTKSVSENAVARHIPFLKKVFETQTTTNTLTGKTERRYKIMPEKFAEIVKGGALGRISGENQLYKFMMCKDIVIWNQP